MIFAILLFSAWADAFLELHHTAAGAISDGLRSATFLRRRFFADGYRISSASITRH